MKNIKKFDEYNESMLPANSLAQMKRVSDILNGLDIGKRVSDDSFANSLDVTKRDIVKSGVETYDDFMDEPFEDNQNRKPWTERKKKK